MTANKTGRTTAERANKMRSLIACFEIRELSMDEITAQLELSPSGGRKYRDELVQLGIIERIGFEECLSKNRRYGQAIYKLTADDSAKVQFLAALKESAVIGRCKTSTPNPTRHFHILADDQSYAIKVRKSAIVRDWAVAALFGPAPVREAV